MFSDKVVVITGGNSGIGRATAERFAHEGAQVFIIGRNEESVHKAATELGGKVFPIVADVRDVEQVRAAVDEIVTKTGKVDVLVNNAGTGGIPAITTRTPLDEALRSWNKELNIHLTANFLMAMAVAPHMTRPGGRIINVSSIAAFTGGRRAGAMGYAAAKAGILGLTYALARELSSEGITVNAIAPGVIERTGFTGDWPAETIESIVSQVPAGRAGTAADVAAAIVSLSSPMSSYISGQVLHVNGGWLFGR